MNGVPQGSMLSASVSSMESMLLEQCEEAEKVQHVYGPN